MFSNNLLMAAAGGGVELVEVANSTKWDSSSSQYMTYTQGTPTNARKFTESVWYYKCGQAAFQQISSGYDTTQDRSGVYIYNDDTVQLQGEVGGATPLRLRTNRKIRDNGWYHLLFIWDGDNATDADRAQIWINGVKETSFLTEIIPAQGTDIDKIQDGYTFWISRHPVSTNYIDGYTAEQVLIDGAALDPSNFGEFSADGLYFTPKDPADILTLVDTYAGNTFYLNNAANPYTDASAQSNDFTAYGTPVISDHTPTNMKCLMNPLYPEAGTLENAGIIGVTDDGDGALPVGTLFFDSEDTDGWYVEAKPTTTGSTIGAFYPIGIVTPQHVADHITNVATDAGSYLFSGGGGINHTSFISNGTWDAYANGTGALNDIFQMVVKNGSIYFGINNTWYDSSDGTFANAGAAFTGVTGFYTVGFQHASASTGKCEFYTAVEDQTYTAPTDTKAINTTNIAAATTRTVSDPYKHWANCLYDGTGAALDITIANETPNGSTFDPEFVWTKNRDQDDEHKIVDIVRGATKELNSDSNNAESTDANGVTSITSTDKYVLGTGAGGYNDSGEAFVGWAAKLGGAAASNEDGSITSSVSVNTTLGMSVGTYTGTGSTATVGHGLSTTPGMIIVKKTSGAGDSWTVYHSGNTSAPETDYLSLDVTAATSDYPIWNDTAPTSSVFSVYSAEPRVNETSATYMFIAFAPSEFISIGSYEGNANADGPYVPCINSAGIPLQPIWSLVKNIDTVKNWVLIDAGREPYNVMDNHLEPDTSDAEPGEGAGDWYRADMVSGGIKLRGTGQPSNYTTLIHLTIGIPVIDKAGRILTAR